MSVEIKKASWSRSLYVYFCPLERKAGNKPISRGEKATQPRSKTETKQSFQSISQISNNDTHRATSATNVSSGSCWVSTTATWPRESTLSPMAIFNVRFTRSLKSEFVVRQLATPHHWEPHEWKKRDRNRDNRGRKKDQKTKWIESHYCMW